MSHVNGHRAVKNALGYDKAEWSILVYVDKQLIYIYVYETIRHVSTFNNLVAV